MKDWQTLPIIESPSPVLGNPRGGCVFEISYKDAYDSANSKREPCIAASRCTVTPQLFLRGRASPRCGLSRTMHPWIEFRTQCKAGRLWPCKLDCLETGMGRGEFSECRDNKDGTDETPHKRCCAGSCIFGLPKRSATCLARRCPLWIAETWNCH